MSTFLVNTNQMKFYDYYRSSASYRVRIALQYKNIECAMEHVHLVENGGEHLGEKFTSDNPQQLVPLLIDGELRLNQSLAILEYLEEKFPDNPLLPENLAAKMEIKAFCLEVACEIHPLNNLRVLKYLKSEFNNSDEQKKQWYHHWLRTGFTSLEKRVAKTHGNFCFGDSPTWADLFMIPQIYNAYRFDFNMDDYPILKSINDHCLTLSYFKKASPEERLKEL